MKKTSFFVDCKESQIKFNQEEISNNFDFILQFQYPNYSREIEFIETVHIDKSNELSVSFCSPTDLSMSIEFYTQLMRCVHLNMTFTDNFIEEYNFSHTGDIFNSTDHIVYMWVKVFLKSPITLNFMQEKEKFAQMLLSNSEK